MQSSAVTDTQLHSPFPCLLVRVLPDELGSRAVGMLESMLLLLAGEALSAAKLLKALELMAGAQQVRVVTRGIQGQPVYRQAAASELQLCYGKASGFIRGFSSQAIHKGDTLVM